MDQIKIDVCFGCLGFDIDTSTAIKYGTVSLKMNPARVQIYANAYFLKL